MKVAAERPYADPEAAARKLIEIANSVEAAQDGRIFIWSTGRFFTNTKARRPNTRPGLSSRSNAAGWWGPDLCEVHASGRGAVRLMAKGWRQAFDDPIDLPRGGQLVTLEDAGNYITKLPKAELERQTGRMRWKP
jgi:hypothetical protein